MSTPNDSILLDGDALPRVVVAGIARDPPGTAYREHRVDLLEINFITGGATDGVLNGQPHCARAGHAYTYLPGDTFKGAVAPGLGVMVCRWVKFVWPGWPGAVRGRMNLARQIALSPQAQADIQTHFDALLDAHAGGQACWELIAGGQLMAIIGTLVRDSARTQDSSGNGALDRRLSTACAFMEQNFARRLKISDVAASAHLADDYFSRTFRRRLGVSPLQYLIRVRIREGRRLLAENPGLTIRETSRRAGFDDARHFARSFRKLFGLTPGQFRSELAPPYKISAGS